jgi:hypothetical protein
MHFHIRLFSVYQNIRALENIIHQLTCPRDIIFAEDHIKKLNENFKKIAHSADGHLKVCLHCLIFYLILNSIYIRYSFPPLHYLISHLTGPVLVCI